MIKVTPQIHEMISERIVGILKMVDTNIPVEISADEKGELSVKLYEGLYEFFKSSTIKYEGQISHIKALMVGKEKKHVDNLVKQINKIIERSQVEEQEAVYKIIHEWEETLTIEGVKDVQAN